MRPALGRWMPLAAMKIELLPAPFAPSSTTSSPGSACSVTPLSARKLP
jgi:hypothetical protein